MAYLDFKEFPNLIKFYTTIGYGTLLKEEYNTIKECTLLKDIKILCTYPNCISQTTLPTKSSITTIVVKNFLHYYWSIPYPIQFLVMIHMQT